MKAIAAHFRYISKNGRLDIETEQGDTVRGKSAVHELGEDWRYGGSLIGEEGYRREAFNIMLSMPRGTDPLIVQKLAEKRLDRRRGRRGRGTQIDQQDPGFRGHVCFLSFCCYV